LALLTWEIKKSDITLYSDANWGSNTDDQRSISRYVSMLSGGATTWSSKKQPTVMLPSMEAEYMALSNTNQENIWIWLLFSELGQQLSPPPKYSLIIYDECWFSHPLETH
jgi:hypothetical protein